MFTPGNVESLLCERDEAKTMKSAVFIVAAFVGAVAGGEGAGTSSSARATKKRPTWSFVPPSMA